MGLASVFLTVKSNVDNSISCPGVLFGAKKNFIVYVLSSVKDTLLDLVIINPPASLIPKVIPSTVGEFPVPKVLPPFVTVILLAIFPNWISECPAPSRSFSFWATVIVIVVPSAFVPITSPVAPGAKVYGLSLFSLLNTTVPVPVVFPSPTTSSVTLPIYTFCLLESFTSFAKI